MIASVAGKVASVGSQSVVIDVAGIGYLVHAPSSVLAALKPGRQTKLLTELVVREDSFTLFGFQTPQQRELFSGLTSVTGLGPKLALSVLSSFSPDSLRRVILAGDVDALTTVPGIGKRGAQRIVLELKDKLGIATTTPEIDSKTAEVREALVNLGYTPAEVREIVLDVAESDEPIEDLIRSALKELART